MYRLKDRYRSYRGIEAQLKDEEERLNLLWYEASGVKGIRYDKIGGSAYERLKFLKRLDLYERIEISRQRIEALRSALYELNLYLDSMDTDTAEAIREIYINGRRYVDVAEEQYISKSALEKRVNKALEEIEKRMHPPN